MSKKNSLLISFSLLFILAPVCFAAENYWNNSTGDNNWNTISNWSLSRIPNSSDNARIAIITGPVFSAGQTATALRVFLQGTNGSLTMDGGTLTTSGTSSYFGIGHSAAADSGTLNVNSGTINITGTGTSGIFYCGTKGPATVNMSGGAINISNTFNVARDSGGSAIINLSGGTITCGTLTMRGSGGIGTIDITNTGKLIISGDATSTINTYIGNGWIKAYNGAGTVMFDYNITNSGKTTLWASVPTKAGGPTPANNAINVNTLTDLSWTGVAGATSHKVYFGTTSPGTYQADTTSTTFDVGRLGVSAASHNVYFGTTNPPAFVINQTAATFNTGKFISKLLIFREAISVSIN
jgi:hypothetical protein